MNPEELRQIHYDYLLSGDVVNLTTEPFSDRSGDPRLFGSELSMCPIRTSFRRMGAVKTHPLLDTDYATLLRFRQGHAVATSWKEAMCWKFSLKAEVERSVVWLGVQGHIDTDITIDEQIIPIEVKNTTINVDDPKNEATRAGHILQLQFYMAAVNAPYGFLIYQRREDNDIWRFGRDDCKVKEAIGRHSSDGALQELTIEVPSIATVPKYWCCKEDPDERVPREALRRSKNYERGEVRPGAITVSCPWFGCCHGNKAYSYTTSYNDNGELVLLPG